MPQAPKTVSSPPKPLPRIRHLPPSVRGIWRYVEQVLGDKLVVGRLARLACERHVRDCDQAGAKGLYFDADAAAKVLDYFPEILRHSKGEWAGSPVILEPWQQFRIGSVFGWKWRDTKLRRYRTAYNTVGRKNGKSTEAAGLGLFCLTSDGEPGAEVVSYATKRDQARIVWSEGRRMVTKAPALKQRLKLAMTRIAFPAQESWWDPLSNDHDSMDGLNVHLAIADELHAHKNRAAFDVIDTAMGSRRQPLHWIISTRGANVLNICGELDFYSQKILQNEVQDDSFFAYIACIDEKKGPKEAGDEWDDETAWVKANPNLGKSVKLTDLKQLATKARQMPSAQNEFRRKRCNLWTEAVERWIDYRAWQDAALNVPDEELAGRPFWMGLDLSASQDLTALVRIIDLGNGQVVVRCRFWLPEDGIIERERRDRIDYRQWHQQGWLELTPGKAINKRMVAAALAEEASLPGAVACAYDRWRIKDLWDQLDEMGFRSQIVRPDHEGKIKPKPGQGFPLVEAGQGYRDMSPAVQEIETLIANGDFLHGGNPVLTMCASNAVITKDAADNRKFDKAKAIGRIDGVVAAAMACILRKRLPYSSGSVYEDRGFEVM
jgi:phage terminase large subunit-like protein